MKIPKNRDCEGDGLEVPLHCEIQTGIEQWKKSGYFLVHQRVTLNR